MKNLIKYFIVCIFISCNQKQNSTDKTKMNIKENSTVKHAPDEISNKNSHQPLFLGLSPYMQETEFDRQINKLNEKGSLDGYIFPIKLNTYYAEFLISKTSNSIKLTFEAYETKTPFTTNRRMSEDIFSKYNTIKNEVLGLYTAKYKKNNLQLPTNINFEKYNLTKENYLLFKDDNKYILLGYTMNGGSYPSLEEKKEKERESGLDKDAGYMTMDLLTYNPSEVQYKFGCEIEVDYYPQKDLEKIIEKMNEESRIIDKEVKKRTEINSLKEKNKSKNIDEI